MDSSIFTNLYNEINNLFFGGLASADNIIIQFSENFIINEITICNLCSVAIIGFCIFVSFWFLKWTITFIGSLGGGYDD